MTTIDLLKLKGAVDAEPMEDMLRTGEVELVFNGRLVWGDIVGAIVAARNSLAASAGVPETGIAPNWLEVVVYHPEEEAIYVAVEFVIPRHGPCSAARYAKAEQIFRRGATPGTVIRESASVGTSARILELMDAIDLKRALWLPYSDG